MAANGDSWESAHSKALAGRPSDHPSYQRPSGTPVDMESNVRAHEKIRGGARKKAMHDPKSAE